ncbi:hypothetical protein BIY24_15190 [Halobacteriovorax marinus]|uniref:response regulator n=1 Tax=Halobacteriovorax marinus TaxID=97084 RepID=UPI000BC31AA3|nr:response regulator [Halobacteriovorax marinus]ATH09237.1 hypothetical protein BIY24_15190 [Halobacteriovorax marinus]
MAEKILVADDSLTIQKVIAITLSNTDYELVECLNESDLIKKVESSEFDLILLDFNLSESLSGYDLAKKIKGISSNSEILAMLGTFDSIDDYQLSDSGIGDKIVKPFESEKFIQKCRMLLDNRGDLADINLDEEESSYNEEIQDEVEEDIIGDDWVVDSPKPSDNSSATLSKSDQEPEELVFDEAQAEDALSEEMKGWGIEVPNVIGAENKFGVFPPKIEAQESSAEEVEFESSLPSDEDMDYPDSDSSISASEIDDVEVEEDLDATDPSFQMPQEFQSQNVQEHASLEDEIDKEDFWAVDEESDQGEEELSENENSFDTATSANIEDLDDIAEEEVDQIFADLESEIDSEKESYSVDAINPSQLENDRSPAIDLNIDTDEIVAQVKDAITPALEELVQKFCREKIEQVAWEVIPDLAENLIKKEIKDITSTLKH